MLTWQGAEETAVGAHRQWLDTSYSCCGNHSHVAEQRGFGSTHCRRSRSFKLEHGSSQYAALYYLRPAHYFGCRNLLFSRRFILWLLHPPL